MTKLPKLPHGLLTQLAVKLNCSRNTVYKWRVYWIPEKRRHEVETAVRELLGEVDGREAGVD